MRFAHCPQSDYAANVELAEALPSNGARKPPTATMRKIPTPARRAAEDVADLLGVPIEKR